MYLNYRGYDVVQAFIFDGAVIAFLLLAFFFDKIVNFADMLGIL